MIAILTGMRWNLSTILICISFMVKDVEHFFMYLLAIYNYSGMRWNLSTILICISFMVKDVEHFFIYLLAIYNYSEIYSFINWIICSFAI
jgi:hypothetical protein